jgi:peptidoglycan hydrolase-like protein with peptidoglycan-binding domain
MRLIPNQLTNMTALDVLRAFRSAFESSIGRTPSNSTLAILVAQSCLECGRWHSMHCYNFGNIRPPKDWSADYCQFRCNEKINGQWVWFDPPASGSSFVAFETPEAGAAFYMNMMSQHWPEAWTAALNGNVIAFVHGLKQRGYFTADEAPYRAGVSALCAEFFDYMNRGLVNPAAPPDAPAPVEPSPALIDIVASAVRIAPALLLGAVGESVKAWQKVVDTPQDGVFGPLTESATRAWQLQNGLPVTGAVCEPDLQKAKLA